MLICIIVLTILVILGTIAFFILRNIETEPPVELLFKPLDTTNTFISDDSLSLISDEDSVLVGETQKITFWAEVKTDEYKRIEKIPLKNYKEDTILEYLYDDGTHGDKMAGDGFYTNQIDMKSDIRESKKYYTEINGKKSNLRDITYWKSHTDEEWEERNTIAKEIVGIKETYKYTGNSRKDENSAKKMLNSLYEYLENQIELGNIREYKIYNDHSTVILNSGIPIISQFSFVPGYQSSSSIVTPEKTDWKKPLINDDNKQKIITLEPCKDDLKSNNYDDSAKQVVKSNSKYEFNNNLDNQDVTIEVLENLSEYRIIIINTHGGWDSEYHSYFLISEVPTEDFHEKYKEYINKYIFPMDNDEGVFVTYKFFENVYKNKPFNNSLIYIGACGSMQDNILHNTLINCGAKTVIGFKNLVMSTYNEKMCKTIFNVLSRGNRGNYNTISESVNQAKSKHGQVGETTYSTTYSSNDDVQEKIKKSEPRAELICAGSQEFKLSDNIDIFSSRYDNLVKNEFTLNIYNSEKELHSNYNLKIEQIYNSSDKLSKEISEKDITDKNKKISLDDGTYILTITNSENPEQKKVIKIFVWDFYINADKIDVKTEFTSNKEETENTTPSVNEIKKIYEDFIKQNGYKEYVKEWEYSANKYAILDIDGDGIAELIIINNYNSDNDGGSHNCLIFTCEKNKVKLLKEIYYGGLMSHSNKYNAIEYFSEPNQYGGTHNFSTVKDFEYVDMFSIIVDRDKKVIYKNGKESPIRDDEINEHLDDCEIIEFLEISSLREITETWKKLYIEYINNRGENSYISENAECILVNINDDDIPELVINNGSVAGGGDVFTVHNDKLENVHIYTGGFSHMERKNLFADVGGRMDYYHDKVYRIQNGKFELINKGEYWVEDSSNREYDDKGNMIYTYRWNDKKVSKEKYEQELKSVFDKSKAVSPYEEKGVSIKDIISEIEGY